MTQQKEVFQKFLTAFRKLKEWTDDTPEVLENNSESDQSLANLCFQVSDLFLSLLPEMKKQGPNIYDNIDQSTLIAYRDFENRYERYVMKVVHSYFRRQILETFEPVIDPEILELKASAIKAVDIIPLINRTKMELAENSEYRRDQEFESKMLYDLSQANLWLRGKVREKVGISYSTHTAIDYILEFVEHTGLDFFAAKHRCALVRPVFIPEHISKKFGNQKQIALYKSLQQALNAFVFGSPAAAIALIRSVVEVVLSEHYGSRGRDLHELIDNAKGLPTTARPDKLHKIRRVAKSHLALLSRR